MVGLALTLAYIRPFGEEAFRIALRNAAVGLFCAAVIGTPQRRWIDSLLWSLIGGGAALICTLTLVNVPDSTRAYWSAVGTISGALAGAFRPGFWWAKCWRCLAFWAAIALWRGLDWGRPEEFFDIVLAGPVMLALIGLSEVVGRLQTRYRTATAMWAAGLIFAAILGNYGAVLVWRTFYR